MNTSVVRKIIGFVVKVAVSGLFITFMASRLDVADIVSTIRNIDLGLLAAATLLYFVTQVISTKRWSYFLTTDKGFHDLFALYMIGAFFNLILPGTVGGDTVKAYYLYKDTRSKTDSLVSVFMERYMGLTAMLAVACVGFVIGLPLIEKTFVVKSFVIIIASFLAASLFVIFFPYEMFYSKLANVRASIGRYMRDRRIMLHTFVLSLFVQIIGVAVVYLIGRALGIESGILVYFIFIPIISVISMLPVSFSGLGVREASFYLLFSIVGVDKEQAVGLSLVWFLVMILSGVVGFVYYLRLKQR